MPTQQIPIRPHRAVIRQQKLRSLKFIQALCMFRLFWSKQDTVPEITYHYGKESLEMVCQGMLTYNSVDLLNFYSPLNFKNKDLLKK